MLNYFSVVILPLNGKIQVCESRGQSPSKAPNQADELLWSIPEPTTHWLWLSGACSHKQILAENLCCIAFDLCFQLEQIFLAHFPAPLYCCLHAISISQLHLISRLLFKGVFFFCGVWLTFQNEGQNGYLWGSSTFYFRVWRELGPTGLAALKEQTCLLTTPNKSLCATHFYCFFKRSNALHSPRSSHKIPHGIFHNNQAIISIMIVSFDKEQNSSHIHTLLA